MGKENPGKASVVLDPGLQAGLGSQAQGNGPLQTLYKTVEPSLEEGTL